MADTDAVKEAKKFYEDVPMQTPGFFLKGTGALDWGMKNRLAQIFNPGSGRTVMFAIDQIVKLKTIFKIFRFPIFSGPSEIIFFPISEGFSGLGDNFFFRIFRTVFGPN